MPSWKRRRGNWEQQSCSSSLQQKIAHICTILQGLAFNCFAEAVAGARKTCDCCPPGTQEMTDMTRDDKGMLCPCLGRRDIEHLCDRVFIGAILCHSCHDIRSIVLCYRQCGRWFDRCSPCWLGLRLRYEPGPLRCMPQIDIHTSGIGSMCFVHVRHITLTPGWPCYMKISRLVAYLRSYIMYAEKGWGITKHAHGEDVLFIPVASCGSDLLPGPCRFWSLSKTCPKDPRSNSL